MTLMDFEQACVEYLRDPEKFGHDAMTDCLHFLADEISDDDLTALASTIAERLPK